jgi:hypothetical protein
MSKKRKGTKSERGERCVILIRDQDKAGAFHRLWPKPKDMNRGASRHVRCERAGHRENSDTFHRQKDIFELGRHYI